MMIRVTEYTPTGRGKVRVCLENGVSLILYRGEAGQMKSGSISEEDYRRLLAVITKRAKKRAMYLLERMDRTEHQLREKLEAGGYPPECVDAAVEYVRFFHYLDDYRYACNFIHCRKDKQSRRQLQMKLAAKGVDRELIHRALEEEYDADESVLIHKLLLTQHFTPDCGRKEFARTYQYLLRRGFKSSEILRNMREFAPSFEIFS